MSTNHTETPTLGLHCELESLIAWDAALEAPRYAGGHDEVLRAIFGTSSEVIAWWHEGDYSGQVAIAHRLADGRVVVITDYYGSCSGCDAWEDANEDEARKMIADLVNGARVFAGIEEAKAWCSAVDSEQRPYEYPFEAARNLKWPEAETPPAEPAPLCKTCGDTGTVPAMVDTATGPAACPYLGEPCPDCPPPRQEGEGEDLLSVAIDAYQLLSELPVPDVRYRVVMRLAAAIHAAAPTPEPDPADTLPGTARFEEVEKPHPDSLRLEHLVSRGTPELLIELFDHPERFRAALDAAMSAPSATKP